MTPFQTALRYGGYTGLVLIVLGLILYVAGVIDYSDLDGPQKYIQWVNYAIILGGIIMAMKFFKSENEGVMAYGQGVGLGTLTALVVGVITFVWMMVFFNLIDPGAIDQIRTAAMDKAMEKNNLTEEQMEAASGMMNMFTSPIGMGVMAVIFTTIMGLIMSLIASAFLKSDASAAA